MLKKLALLTVILTAFAAVNAFADSCATGNFVGTYTRPSSVDVFGDGSVIHNYVFQLTLHADGTVTQYWTGLPDYQNNLGTGSINIGAWKCRENGNLLVTLLSANYEPAPADPNLGTVDDIKLLSHSRSTMVFNIDNNNQLTRLKVITRTYAPAQDPTDPNGGALGPLNTTQVVYRRLVASAADLQ
jgi:hypothetical protein